MICYKRICRKVACAALGVRSPLEIALRL